MAVYKIYPSKDTVLYSIKPLANSGLDEILETSIDPDGDIDQNGPQVSRVLIQFDQNDILDIISNKISGSSWSSNLRLFKANITGLNNTTKLYVYPVSESWNMGTGKFYDSPITTNGSSWNSPLVSGSSLWKTSSFSAYVTSSFLTSNPGGGNWYTGSSNGLNIVQTQSFDYYSDLDINVNVTDTIRAWVSGTFSNSGFLIKQSDSAEFNSNGNYNTEMKYFSRDTHTIYPPYLEFKWNDYSFLTGSSYNVINTQEIFFSIITNKQEYPKDSVEKFRINVRPLYPTRTFQTSSIYTNNYFLPTSSYYAIKDLDTNEFVVDFDTTYTKISTDSTSNYFNLYMNGLQENRYYEILIKTIIDGSTLILSNKSYFKVING
jgi:hypothetical protein